MTRLDNLHSLIAHWFVQHGGKLEKIKTGDFGLTEIKTESWTVFIGPDTWSDEPYELQTESLDVAILIDAFIDQSQYEEDEFKSLINEMQNQINEDSVTLIPNYPDRNALWLARSIVLDEADIHTLDPILKYLTFWADAAYEKFASWPNTPRFKLINDVNPT